jgi:hypothetical protein
MFSWRSRIAIVALAACVFLPHCESVVGADFDEKQLADASTVASAMSSASSASAGGSAEGGSGGSACVLLPTAVRVVAADATLDQQDASTNFGAATTIKVNSTFPTEYQHAALKIDFEDLKDRGPLVSAQVCAFYFGGSGTITVELYPLRTAWLEDEVTWTHATLATPWRDPGGDRGAMLDSVAVPTDMLGADAEVCFDATAFVAEVFAEAATNHGFLLYPKANQAPFQYLHLQSKELFDGVRAELRIDQCEP